jgi:hypothetical protein
MFFRKLVARYENVYIYIYIYIYALYLVVVGTVYLILCLQILRFAPQVLFSMLWYFVFPLSTQMHGEWRRTVGSEGHRPGQFNHPRGLALTPDEDFLLVVDCFNRRIAVLLAWDGTWVRQLTGPSGTLENPVGVAVVPSTGEVLVSDGGRDRVIRFRSIVDDTVVGTLGTGRGSGPTEFRCPFGLAVLDSSQTSSVRFVFPSSFG